ncbi:ATP-binding protein [Microaerobacter geothermalis]|uniref:ATP-binding protein n=1 Tax=Microaerobacter geothermalis TaxID=674972 RepID=UPI001F1CCA71|nr:ATP-binding protein [Microaerobacter geothermalis]MCF6093697.1 ATP-binding protein [Microaerobacter geothermalis]
MNQIGIHIGVKFSEEEMGTNSISLALKHDHVVEVVGTDHYHYHLHQSAYYSIPFHFPDIKDIRGTISIMTSIEYASSLYVSLLSTMVDSIERELLLRKQNERLELFNQMMIRTTRNGIIITDNQGRVNEMNDFAEKLLGYPKEKLQGNKLYQLEPIGKYIRSIISEGKPCENVELKLHSKEGGKPIVCLFDAVPIYDENDEFFGVIVQFRDITERYELEKQIISSEKFSIIGKLADGLAHEIRNPLTTVSGFIHLLKERYSSTEPEQQYLHIITDELSRMNKLVTDFVLTAKPDSPIRKALNIDEVLEETVQLMRTQAILFNISVHYISYHEPVIVMIDKSQMKQVFMNMIQNAIESMPRGGEITVKLEHLADQNETKIMIQDEGIGMEEEEIKHIFNPFYSTKEEGLGLGLSICYRIIENHGGRIEVISDKNNGSTFTIVLPCLMENK